MFKWLLKRLKSFDIVGEDGSVYLRRYFLLKTDRLKIYIHHILRSDDDRALHCHPWPFTSIIVDGSYKEITPGNPEGRMWHRFSVIRHKAEDAHRLVLDKPVWTLVFIGRKCREWGFHTPGGWVHWREYLDNKFSAAPKQKDHEVSQATKYMED